MTEPTCTDCESFIHRTFTHAQLRDTYNTIESIQAHEGYRRFLTWLLRQHPESRFNTARNRLRDPRKSK